MVHSATRSPHDDLEFRSRASILGVAPNLAAIPDVFSSDLAAKLPPRHPHLPPQSIANEILRVSPRIHYIEYLVRKIRLTQLEPLPLLNVDDLETCVRRAGLKLPANWYGRELDHYRNDLVEVNESGEPRA